MVRKVRFKDPSIDATQDLRWLRDFALSVLRISQGRINFDGMFHHKTLKITANLLANDECVILADATSGAITITLPDAESALDRVYYIKKTDVSANTVTIDGENAETIDGAITETLTAQFETIQIVSDGTEWFII